MTLPRAFVALSGSFVLSLGLLLPCPTRGQEGPEGFDQKIMAAEKAGSDAMKNLTYLCDQIGPRLTGSNNLKRANECAANKMKEYGLVEVHQEPWEMPEGWERGIAEARLLEPNTGLKLSLASYGWYPGTKGKIQAPVVALNLSSSQDLAKYKGKLKGAVILSRPPAKLGLADDIDKQSIAKRDPSTDQPTPRAADEQRRYIRELADFLVAEGAAAIFTDSAKHYGLLVTTGGWQGKDRPSAGNRLPQLFVAHNHYEMLYRLASRPAPEQTRIELEVRNEYVPGPLVVNNTVGEIRGSEKPEEIVVCGAHLDSWDLGQGATDNGTGAIVVLEAARLLAKSNAKPKRTIRFILFTGEEQGLHGSKAYVERHKDELSHFSACLVDDTGTGKIVGVDARHRPLLQPLLAKELAGLKELGVVSFDNAFISGSDHASFDRVGVPGLLFRQDVAGYRLNHHTQIDTPDRAIEPNLVQAAQVMAISALHIANLDALLPREKTAMRKERPSEEKKSEEKKTEEKKKD
jgi:hypothetical protein